MFGLDSESPSSPPCGSNSADISQISTLREGAFLCRMHAGDPGGQSLTVPPAPPPPQTGPEAVTPPRWPGSPGLSSRGSSLDAVPEMNPISVKSCNGPSFCWKIPLRLCSRARPGCQAPAAVLSSAENRRQPVGFCNEQAGGFRWRANKISARHGAGRKVSESCLPREWECVQWGFRPAGEALFLPGYRGDEPKCQNGVPHLCFTTSSGPSARREHSNNTPSAIRQFLWVFHLGKYKEPLCTHPSASTAARLCPSPPALTSLSSSVFTANPRPWHGRFLRLSAMSFSPLMSSLARCLTDAVFSLFFQNQDSNEGRLALVQSEVSWLMRPTPFRGLFVSLPC